MVLVKRVESFFFFITDVDIKNVVESVCAFTVIGRKKGASNMPSRERDDEGCDARNDDSSTEDGLINNKFTFPLSFQF